MHQELSSFNWSTKSIIITYVNAHIALMPEALPHNSLRPPNCGKGPTVYSTSPPPDLNLYANLTIIWKFVEVLSLLFMSVFKSFLSLPLSMTTWNGLQQLLSSCILWFQFLETSEIKTHLDKIFKSLLIKECDLILRSEKGWLALTLVMRRLSKDSVWHAFNVVKSIKHKKSGIVTRN